MIGFSSSLPGALPGDLFALFCPRLSLDWMVFDRSQVRLVFARSFALARCMFSFFFSLHFYNLQNAPQRIITLERSLVLREARVPLARCFFFHDVLIYFHCVWYRFSIIRAFLSAREHRSMTAGFPSIYMKVSRALARARYTFTSARCIALHKRS